MMPSRVEKAITMVRCVFMARSFAGSP